jgi:hypothetical protein
MSPELKSVFNGIALATAFVGAGGIAIDPHTPVGLVLIVLAIGMKIVTEFVEKVLDEQR